MYRYIGNKTRLLSHIMERVQQLIGDSGTVADVMAGTGSVAVELRKSGYKVVASDVMTYSYHHLVSNLLISAPPTFKGLIDAGIVSSEGVNNYPLVLDYLNTLEGKESFFFREFSPDGRPLNGTPARKYFTSSNAKKIDAIREKINDWMHT